MPGHGQGRAFAKHPLTVDLDVTEVPGLDDLHAPTGPIQAAQQLAAEAFGADETFFLVQGATVGIQALFLGMLKPGDRVLLPRASHRAAFGAMVLSGAVPSYVPPICEPGTGLPIGTDWSAVTESVVTESVVTDLVVTESADMKPAATQPAAALAACLALRPTYWGIAEDLAPWRRIAQAQQVPLWVDEAHGGAFAFSGALPTPALELGAQAVVQGSHKTLPVLTQAAMLHLRLGADDPPGWRDASLRIRQALTVQQTTSPSYLLMASLDLARAQLEECGDELWARTMARADQLRKKLKRLKGFHLWGEEILSCVPGSILDRTRLMIAWSAGAFTGFTARQWLRRQWGIEAELAGRDHLLFLLSPFDAPGTDDKLEQAVTALAEELAGSPGSGADGRNGASWSALFRHLPPAVCTPREAFFAPRRIVPWREAQGQVIGEMICPYPPGIPLVVPGEVLTAEVCEAVALLGQAGAQWQGPADPTLATIAILDE